MARRRAQSGRYRQTTSRKRCPIPSQRRAIRPTIDPECTSRGRYSCRAWQGEIMPREPRVQAQAELGDRFQARSSPGLSPWLVAGFVVVAVSLVAIGPMVALRSLEGGSWGPAGQPAPPPTPTRPTPGVFTVGKQGEGPTPTPSNDASPPPAAPNLNPPAGS